MAGKPLGFGENYDRIAAVDSAIGPVTVCLHPPGRVTPSHEHGHAHVLFVLSGQVSERAPRGEHWQGTGELIAHAPGDRHANRHGPEGATSLVLHLREPFALPPVVRVMDPRLRAATQSLAAEVLKSDLLDRLTLEALAAEVLHRVGSGAAGWRDRPPITRVVQALDDQPEREWTLSELASLACRHPTHLARAFRDATGVTIGGWRRRRRLTCVALALRAGDTPLADVAASLGYVDQSHMSREFKSCFGCSPGTYRTLTRRGS